jgi:hypothetical protein
MNKLALVATTAAVSAGGAFAVDAAVSSAGNHHRGAHQRALHARLAHMGRHVVHADLVVARRDGTFPTITIDRGTIAGVDGSTIHLREGTAQAVYKTVDLTLPTDAIVRVNGRRGTIADLHAGMRAAVAQLPKRTVVRARG